jgi:excisionase family DNA binding protein
VSAQLPSGDVSGQLLTAEQVAQRLGMTKGWVWAQVRADRIPHVRLGRYRRFREEAIDEWVRQLERGGERSRAPGP